MCISESAISHCAHCVSCLWGCRLMPCAPLCENRALLRCRLRKADIRSYGQGLHDTLQGVLTARSAKGSQTHQPQEQTFEAHGVFPLTTSLQLLVNLHGGNENMRHAKLKGKDGGRDDRCMCYISVSEQTVVREGLNTKRQAQSLHVCLRCILHACVGKFI